MKNGKKFAFTKKKKFGGNDSWFFKSIGECATRYRFHFFWNNISFDSSDVVMLIRPFKHHVPKFQKWINTKGKLLFHFANPFSTLISAHKFNLL